MKPTLRTLSLALLFCLTYGGLYAQVPVLAFEGAAGLPAQMYVMSSGDLSTVQANTALTATNGDIIGRIVGATYNFDNDEVYILAGTGSIGAKNNRKVFRVDTASGSATLVVAPTGNGWQDIAYVGNNRYLMTGGQLSGAQADAIVELDTVTGASTTQSAITSPNTVHTITYNPDDDSLYYLTQGAMNSADYCRAYDTATWTFSSKALTSAQSVKSTGATYLGNDTLLVYSYFNTTEHILVPVAGGAPVFETDPTNTVNAGSQIAVAVAMYQPVPTNCASIPFSAPIPQGSLTFCEGDSVQIALPSYDEIAVIEWFSNGNLVPGVTNDSIITVDTSAVITYRITNVCNQVGIASNSIAVTVTNKPHVTIVANNTALCSAGVSADLTANTIQPGGFTYQWIEGDTIIPAFVGSSLTTNTPGSYRVVVTTVDGCVSDTSAAVEVFELTNPINFPNPGDVCAGGGPIALNATPAGGEYFSNGVILTDPVDPDTLQLGLITYTFDTVGCSYEETVTFQIVEPFAFDISVSDTLIDLTNGDSSISAMVVFPNPAYTYNWTVDQTFLSDTGQTVTFNFSTPGNYTINLESVINGCNAFSDKTITVVNTVGRQDVLGADFAMFPNPVNDILSIALGSGSEIERVEVLSADGRVLMQQTRLKGARSSVDVSHLPSGVYLLRVQTTAGTGVQRFVKQ